jgi:eukaryotic translation initiation factor 2C
MLINVDISTGTMSVSCWSFSPLALTSLRYRPGRLLDLCLNALQRPGRPPLRPEQLAPRAGFPERERLRLQRFLAGIRIVTNQKDENGRLNKTPRVVKKLSTAGAGDLEFQMRDGGKMTVAVSVVPVLP